MHEPGFWGAGDREELTGGGERKELLAQLDWDGWVRERKELSAQLDWDGWVRGNMDIFVVSSTCQGSSTVIF